MEKSLLRIFDEVLFAMKKADLISTEQREYLNNELKLMIDKHTEDESDNIYNGKE
jgi:predicted YcjX-like family ATPase